MAAAECPECGGMVRYHTATFRKSGKPTGGTPGWYHYPAGLKKDHAARPHDNRSPESEITRETAHRDQLKAGVRDHLQSGFDHLHAEKTVNEIFNDRR